MKLKTKNKVWLAKLALGVAYDRNRKTSFAMSCFAENEGGREMPPGMLKNECGMTCCLGGHLPIYVPEALSEFLQKFPAHIAPWLGLMCFILGEDPYALITSKWEFLLGKLWPDDPHQAAARIWHVVNDKELPTLMRHDVTYKIPTEQELKDYIERNSR